MENKPVVIVPDELKKQVEEGMKLVELAEFYGLPKSQMQKALKMQGLKIRKFHNPKFVFAHSEVQDEVVPEQEENNVDNTEDLYDLEEVKELPISNTVTW